MRARGVCAALLALPLASPRAQQHTHVPVVPDSTALRFVADARTGTARYRDRSVAIADGYRQVGPDLPSMGEHWLNIGLVLADSVDAARPPVLIYVSTPNGPLLAGAAYTRMLGARDAYPDFPRGLHAWHDHSGFIEDEALPMSHVRQGSAHDESGRTRLGILHLWMWEDNPAGEWTADNWALPFLRDGVRAPHEADAAGRALALVPDSGAYYLGVLTTVGELDGREVKQLCGVLTTAAAQVRGIGLTPGEEPSVAELRRLGSIWQGLWPAIENAVSPPARARLGQLGQMWW